MFYFCVGQLKIKGEFMACKRCSELPKIDFTACQVYLYIPTKHHMDPIEGLLNSQRIDFTFNGDYFLFKVAHFRDLIEDLKAIGFNLLDRKDIKIMPIASEDGLNFGALENLKSLKAWLDLYEGEMVLDVLKHERIKVLFQPIIDVKNKKNYGYEALSRGLTSKNSLIPANVLFKQATAMDLKFYLDRLCRASVIKRAAELGLKERLFINFLPTAIYNPRKCLKTTDEAVAHTDLEVSKIVFEVVETEYVEDFEHLNDILDYYKEKGYSTALDDMGSGHANKESLLSLKPDYMKIDIDIIKDIHKDQKKQDKLKNYLKLVKGRNIKSLAEGVENVDELKYVMAQDIHLVQGYYFAKPSETFVNLDLEKMIP